MSRWIKSTTTVSIQHRVAFVFLPLERVYSNGDQLASMNMNPPFSKFKSKDENMSPNMRDLRFVFGGLLSLKLPACQWNPTITSKKMPVLLVPSSMTSWRVEVWGILLRICVDGTQNARCGYYPSNESYYMGVSKNRGTRNGWLQWKTLLKWMIWGYPYFWKHPYRFY